MEGIEIKNKISFVFGTRPEAVKLAPLIVEMKEQSNFDVKSAFWSTCRDDKTCFGF